MSTDRFSRATLVLLTFAGLMLAGSAGCGQRPREGRPPAAEPVKAEAKPAAEPVKAEVKPAAEPVKAEAKPAAEPVKAEAKPAAPARPNLTNDEIGLDPSLPTNYNVDRIEDVGVPDVPVSGLGGKMIPGGFAGRMGAVRVKLLQENGGNAASEAAVAAGIKWIVDHQAPDGHWSLTGFCTDGKCKCGGEAKKGGHNNDVAGTALGLLALLGSGHTHKVGDDKNNKYTKNVDLAIKYLVFKQNREGEFDPDMLSQGLATIALCEAYGLTSDIALKGPTQRALNYIADAQSKEGGWRLQRRQEGYETAISAWELMALKSGQMGALQVPSATLQRCKKWLDDAASADGGSYGGNKRGDEPGTSAAGLLCRQYLGWGPRNPGLIAGAERLRKIGPKTDELLYSHLATQVVYHLGGEGWEKWNPRMRDGLIQAQDTGKDEPHQKGSWKPGADNAEFPSGRLAATSLAILTLEVYYRHLPLYRRADREPPDPEKKP